MWHIVEDDVRYNATVLGVALGLAAIVTLARVASGSDLADLVGNTTAIYFIALLWMGIREDKEHRERYMALLPLRLRERALGRLVFLVAFQMSIFAMWLVAYVSTAIGDQPELIRGLLSANATTLCLVMAIVVWSDLGHFGNPLYRPGFVLAAVVFVAAKFLATPISRYRTPDGIEIDYPDLLVTETWGDAAFWMVVFVGLVALSVTVYERRHEYLS